ncbi:MAG: hypothetical protein U9R66_07510 [Thermodesulfobacteriota bacterium]|nr:hypothetical protein [Thermodesulfobacteriota bacterium]
MRCPKCGFISFDQMKSCSKCAHDVSNVMGELKGTALQTQFSFFLGSVVGGRLAGDTAVETPLSEEVEIDSDILGENEEAVGEEQLEIQFDSDEEETGSADLSLDEDVTVSPEIDFSGLEDEESGEESVLQENLDLHDDDLDEDLADLQLSADEDEADSDAGLDLESDTGLGLGAEPESVVEVPDEMERGVKLNIEVDMEDEPDQVEVALDEIDLSDLVIEDDVESDVAESAEESGEEEVIELEALSLDSIEDQDDPEMLDMSVSSESEDNSESSSSDEDFGSLVLENDPAIGELKVESASSEGV